ncbi:hypothetical protein BJ912DRAFT_1065461 [Pholiota molesta]|nr:hypothetical protein BJ912DRAFT_1065461 [Pholiota molesta]
MSLVKQREWLAVSHVTYGNAGPRPTGHGSGHGFWLGKSQARATGQPKPSPWPGFGLATKGWFGLASGLQAKPSNHYPRRNKTPIEYPGSLRSQPFIDFILLSANSPLSLLVALHLYLPYISVNCSAHLSPFKCDGDYIYKAWEQRAAADAWNWTPHCEHIPSQRLSRHTEPPGDDEQGGEGQQQQPWARSGRHSYEPLEYPSPPGVMQRISGSIGDIQ